MPFPKPPPSGGHEDDLPVVRPYTVTAGRTRPTDPTLELTTFVQATTSAAEGYSPERNAIIKLCQQPLSVAEVAAHLQLPISVTRVLLSDLHAAGRITTGALHTTGDVTDDTLEAILNGLRSL